MEEVTNVTQARKRAGRKPRAAEETMTRRELSANIYKKLHKQPRTRKVTAQQILDIVQATIDGLQEAILEVKHIEFRDFGVFEVITRKSRLGRNPNDPQHTVVIPPRRTVKFKPSRKLLKTLKSAEQ